MHATFRLTQRLIPPRLILVPQTELSEPLRQLPRPDVVHHPRNRPVELGGYPEAAAAEEVVAEFPSALAAYFPRCDKRSTASTTCPTVAAPNFRRNDST